MKSVYLLIVLLLFSTLLQAEITPQALLDLVTCYGADFPPEAFQKDKGKDLRLIRIEQTLAGISRKQSIKPAGVPGFYQLDPPMQLLGFPIHFIGMEGYGPFSGISVSLGGDFEAIKHSLQKQQGIHYHRCETESSLHLRTCHQDINDHYGHVIFTHPHDPQRQVILICVDKQANNKPPQVTKQPRLGVSRR